MPVYFITIHAYRSWNADHPRGFIQRGQTGIKKQNRAIAAHRDQVASQEPVRFSSQDQQVIISAGIDIASRRGWRLHGIAATPTHYHLLVSMPDDSEAPIVMATFKRLIGLALSRFSGEIGRRWHSRGGEPPGRVRDREHFEHLMNRYLCKHADEGGLVWTERD